MRRRVAVASRPGAFRVVSLAELEAEQRANWSEAEFTQALRKQATWQGWLFYHTGDSRKSDRGFPDVVMVRQGRLVFAELKVREEKLRKDQAIWIEALRVASSALSAFTGPTRSLEVFVWRPADWVSIKGVLS
jgi:hypothetical protein